MGWGRDDLEIALVMVKERDEADCTGTSISCSLLEVFVVVCWRC